MTTDNRIYGASDDLIQFDGNARGIDGEVGFFDPDNRGAVITCSDGTVLHIVYGKPNLAVWRIDVLRTGRLLDGVIYCDDEDADIYSDIAYFLDGLKWAVVARGWSRISRVSRVSRGG